jgi:hypothetical protein
MSHDNEEKCGICECPRQVTFQERDEETGAYRTQVHTVTCGGHINLRAGLWNKSKEYDDFRRFEVRHREATTKPPRPRNKYGKLTLSRI